MSFEDLYPELQSMPMLNGSSLSSLSFDLAPDHPEGDFEPKADWCHPTPFEFIDPMPTRDQAEVKPQVESTKPLMDESKSDWDDFLAMVNPASAIPDPQFGSSREEAPSIPTAEPPNETKADLGRCFDQLVAETLDTEPVEPPPPVLDHESESTTVSMSDFPDLFAIPDESPMGMSGPMISAVPSEPMTTTSGYGMVTQQLPPPHCYMPPMAWPGSMGVPPRQVQPFPMGFPPIHLNAGPMGPHGMGQSGPSPAFHTEPPAEPETEKNPTPEPMVDQYRICLTKTRPENQAKCLIGVLVERPWGLTVKFVDQDNLDVRVDHVPESYDYQPTPRQVVAAHSQGLRPRTLNILKRSVT